MTQIVLTLASASPRRRALLLQAHSQIECVPADIEEHRKIEETPRDFALRMAQEKALSIKKNTNWIIAGDTVVALGNLVLGKPNSKEEAIQTLRLLSGQTHQVWSGWALRGSQNGIDQIWRSGVSCADVTFKELSLAEITHYVEEGEPMDKAGSYGIQGAGGRFIRSLQGSFDGVMGLPTLDVVKALLEEKVLTPQTPSLLLNSISIRERMRVATWKSGRSADEVQLLAVSKYHTHTLIQEALQYGLTDFGESYLQELTLKRAEFAQEKMDPQMPTPMWHYIGAIQTNKAKRIGASAQWIHGVSRLSELERLSEGAKNTQEEPFSPVLRVFIQVNLSGEPSKGGLTPQELPQFLEASANISGIKIEGLMTFPPLGEPESSRPYFKALRQLRDQLATPERPLLHLSMGTSHDFEVAIEEGATWVRVGSALFGERLLDLST